MASNPSENFVAIPKNAATIIQNNAPGPPAHTAVATPTMFPVPIVALKWMIKNEEGGKGEISSFAALCTALSATIGTGNIVGTGVGQPETAVHQAVQGLTSPSAILFMASYEHFKETASRLKELFPDTPCIGTIGTRLVNGQVSDSGLAVLGFFSDVKIRCGIITEASRCPVAGTTQLLKQIAEISPGTDDTVCVEYCTGSEEKLVTTFTSCLETKGIDAGIFI